MQVWGSPTLGPDGKLYVGSWDWKVHVLNSADGLKAFEYPGSAGIGSSGALGDDGTFYIGSSKTSDANLDNAQPALFAFSQDSMSTGGSKWKYVTGDDVETQRKRPAALARDASVCGPA